MRLHYPLNANGAEDAGKLPWTDGVPATGVEGSYPGHAIVTDVEAEILAAIDAAGLVRSGSDLTQLIQAASRGIWLGLFGGTATALTATLPNSVVIPSLQVGMRVRGVAASDYTGSGGTLALTGIGAAGTTVSYPIVASDASALASGAWKAGQFLTFEIDASSNARLSGASSASASLAAAKAAGSPFNTTALPTNARFSASASTAGSVVTVVSGLTTDASGKTWVKKSANSLLRIKGSFYCHSPTIPGQGNGAVTVRATVTQIASGATFTADAIVNSTFLVAGGGAAGSGGNSPTFYFTGIPAGALSLSIGLKRDDSGQWTTIFGATGADLSGLPTPNPSRFDADELEQTS
ncbi:hypothetical protein [Methylobacterium sp. J-070]|uniref:hypothetical protein n=1 Tax=Methylobacterium sp. J-070 TaxID=2836650 RepID=UPI001FB8EB35|nr:hypothetical protein [Methylobacterium sp. J-070]MCJ2053983.1 hypothetical protein [Methylobacterium sp. J-070]